MVAEKTRRKILTVFMEMVAESSWSELDLRELSEKSGVKLATLRGTYRDKLAVLDDFAAMIDQEVLAGIEAFDEDETAKDRLFDILMARLDALTPYRAGVSKLASATSADPLLAMSMNKRALTSMRWMLSAAGIEMQGLKGSVKLQGLVIAYGRVLRVWLDDTDAGLAQTMAALDRELQRGEGALRQLDKVERFASGIGSALRRFQSRSRNSREDSTGDAEASSA